MGAAELDPRAPGRSPVAPVSRNRQIVEGALLGDISVVLLLGRVYLPIPIVRTAWRFVAGAPLLLLAERQGIRITIMAGLVSYLLLTAFVGPILALTALDTALAATLLATAERWRWPRVLAIGGMGLIYAISDIVAPTILFAVVFRIPVSTLVGDLRTILRSAVRIGGELTRRMNDITEALLGRGMLHIPTNRITTVGYDGTDLLISHWVIVALGMAAILGIANIAGYRAAGSLVLAQLPPGVRTRQSAP